MAVYVRLKVEGQATDIDHFWAAVAYVSVHQDIAEFSYNEDEMLIYASTPAFPWVPEVPGSPEVPPVVADPPPPVEESPPPPPEEPAPEPAP